jgi:hypothetical protein
MPSAVFLAYRLPEASHAEKESAIVHLEAPSVVYEDVPALHDVSFVESTQPAEQVPRANERSRPACLGFSCRLSGLHDERV